MAKIFIPLNTPSSKNSKQWTGKYLVHSKVVTRWLKNTAAVWLSEKPTFLNEIIGLEFPLFVVLHFTRDSKRKFDYHNASQIVFDTMKANGWIEDDNCDVVIPVYKPYTYDKQNPGVYISVIKDESIINILKNDL